MSKETETIGIGVDYGTSNSTAAIFDGNNIHLMPLEKTSPIMPSATFIDKDFQITTGQDAIRSYIESNTGRKVELSAELLGEGRTSTGQIGDQGLPEEAGTDKIYGQSIVDTGQTGRLFRGIKRLLGRGKAQHLMVFDRPFRLVAMITPLLLRIRKCMKQWLLDRLRLQQSTVNHVCIGHPVNFEGSESGSNRTALNLLSEAYSHAGFSQQSFYPEPIAAALSYLHSNPDAVEQTLLAVDFGGGTLDLCVLKRTQDDFTVIATHGIALGGDHIDQLLFKKLIFPLLGKGERWKRAGEDREIETVFPFEEYEELLLNWAVSYMLNQNKYTTPLMQKIQSADEDRGKFRRLYDLIKHNYSYLVVQALKELKAELSATHEAYLDIPELDIELVVSRDQFEAIIAEVLRDFEQAVQQMLFKCQMSTEQIQLVVRTGGSSLIPAVREILDTLFPGKVVEHDPFTSVAAGLAIAEFNGKALGNMA